MARPYAGAAGTHLGLGLLSMFGGVAWICLLYFYDELFVRKDGVISREPIVKQLPPWIIVLLCAKIFCGFWFFLTGAVGCCIKSRGCTEGIYVALNVLNVIIWAPVLLFIMAGLFTIIYFYQSLLNEQGFDGTTLSELHKEFPWLWLFPAVGAFVAVVEFILSIVSYSIVCCCRPESLNEGYEYQYEMK